MKAVILAGGLGTRLSEETTVRPKPMVEIGGRPILWHIMKIYSSHGISDFVLCLGYKGYIIKEYFANYFLHMSDVSFDMRDGSRQIHHAAAEPWRVTLVDTGEETVQREIAVWEGNPEDRYSQDELHGILEEAIDSLKPVYRTVFVLRDVEEMSTEETAEAMNLSIPAVKSRLLRARLQLRERLTRMFRKKGEDLLSYL